MLATKESNPDVLQNSENLVVFRLGLVHYAITVETIRQIIEMVTITPLLKTDTCMEGVINYHGYSIPVINLRRYFGMEVMPYRWHTPIILVNILDRLVGLIVDDVLDVTAVSRAQIISPRSIIPPGISETPLLESIILADNQIILLLNLAHLFDQNQMQALAVAVETLGEQHGQGIVEKSKKSIARKQTSERTPALAGGAREKKAEKTATAQKPTEVAPFESNEI